MTIKLTYFNFDGSRGDECRLALHLSGVEFEDDRLKTPWSEYKPLTPFGSLPVLTMDGAELGQANAILTWVGRTYGLHPSDLWEAARHESVMNYCEELRDRLMEKLGVKEPEDERRRIRQEIADDALQTWAKNVEAQLGAGPFFSGDKLMIVDIKVYMVARWFIRGIVDHIQPDVFADFPSLVALHDAVERHPTVRDWYERRAEVLAQD